MTRIRFEDLPSTNTPRNAENLNKLNNVVISPTEPTTGEEVWIQRSNNLFDIDKASLAWLSRNGNEFSFNDSVYYGELRYNYDFEINKPYTFSFNILASSILTYASVIFFYTDGSYSENTINNTSVGKYSTTFTPTKKVNFLELRFFRLNNNTTQRTGKVTDIQIERGEIATTYEPYIEKKIYTKNDNGVYEEFYNGESLNWKQAINNENDTYTVPISWDNLKEISFRTLGTDSGTFGYVTIPKEQWHNNGSYIVLVQCIDTNGYTQGNGIYKVTTKKSDSFIITNSGTAKGTLIYYR